ncbi:MAG: TylF/MycF/NovP-related O-methyltransferase [Patescibacteria group bacterium]|nr:TylF/MycF/NovP-related O-methyltransferase [Patescibacteria group bacterium]
MKQAIIVDQLLSQHPIISDQISKSALAAVLQQLDKVLTQDVAGAVVEFGCYIGTTSLFMRRLLDAHQQSDRRQLFAYDSFRGLPDKTTADSSGAGEQFKGGELSVSKKQFLQEFHKANLTAPVTVKGWFKELSPNQLPTTVAFAFLDGDFYESIIDSLRLVWPRLTTGGVITIDDYQKEALPGVERAVRDFFQDKTIQLHHEQHIAIITKS